MNANELLPIGSVVLLKEGEKRLMIFGIKQTITDGEELEFDYIGIMYPEGYMGPEYMYLFNHGDINEVVIRGYEDDERKEFISKLSEHYEEDQDVF